MPSHFRSRVPTVVRSVAWALALAAPLPLAGQRAPAGSGAAAGQVVQAVTSRGVMGAFLLAFDGGGEIVGRALSGQDGFFTIVLPAGGPYRLEVESMGYRVATADSLRISAADTIRLEPILLVPDTATTPPDLRATGAPLDP
jgi:hypothetical protein